MTREKRIIVAVNATGITNVYTLAFAKLSFDK